MDFILLYFSRVEAILTCLKEEGKDKHGREKETEHTHKHTEEGIKFFEFGKITVGDLNTVALYI